MPTRREPGSPEWPPPPAQAFDLPSHCEHCGALLMGGATEHKPGCPWLALIAECFGSRRLLGRDERPGSVELCRAFVRLVLMPMNVKQERARTVPGQPATRERDPGITIDMVREAVSIRLLDGALTDADRDFIRAAVVRSGKDWVTMQLSDRLRELIPEIGKVKP